MKQTIIYTALPAGRLNTGGNNLLRLSLHCSMRLSHTSPTNMGMFPEIIQWARKIKEAPGFKVRWNRTDPEDANAETSVIEPSLWETLVYPDIKVSAFVVEDKSKVQIHAYPVKEISETILNVYRDFGIKSPVNMVKPRTFLQNANQMRIGRLNVDQQVISTYGRAAEKTISKPEMRADFKRIKIDREGIIRKNVQSQVAADYSQIMTRGTYSELRRRNTEPEFQFTRFRDFHRLDREALKIKPVEIPVPEFEFHDILAQMGDHPQMQRKIGLVVDLTVPVPERIPAEGIVSVFPSGLTFEADTEISVTATAYRLTANGFHAREREGSDADFYNGFVRLNNGEFAVNQIDTDSVAIQAINQADTQLVRLSEKSITLRTQYMRMTPDEEKVDDEDDEKKFEDDQAEGLPAIRSTGIAIVKTNVEEYLNRKFIKTLDLDLRLATPARAGDAVVTRNMTLLGISAPAKNLNITIPETEVFYAGDLITGYRLDVAYADQPSRWYSLHYKHDEITCFDSDMNPVPVNGILPDEGFCQIAMTGESSGREDMFVSGVIARWTGWSLAVERPGFPIDEAEDEDGRDHITRRTAAEEKKYWSSPDTNIRMNVRTNLVPGTLPRLRFGRAYNLRMRYVDIAGNSVAPDAETERPADCVISNFVYRRYEPAVTPVILQASRLKVGEDIERLVVKSNYDIPADKYSSPDVTDDSRFAARILVPPQVNQLMAEQHGKFDNAFSGDAEAARQIYELISGREMPPGAGESRDRVYSADSFTVKYLPDPVAAGVAFFLAEGYEDSHSQGFRPQMVHFIPSVKSTAANAWLNPTPITIDLREGEISSKWDGKSRLTFFLPKGQRAKIRYSCFWDEESLQKLSGLRHQLSQDRSFAGVREHLAGGRHWMVSPSRELELVHAVQQPVAEPELQETASDRGYQDTPAWIKMKIKIHGQSTGKVDIEASWEEWNDDPLKPLPGKETFEEILDPVNIGYRDQLKHVGYLPPKNPEFRVVNPNAPAMRASATTMRSGAAGRTPVMELKPVTPANARTMTLIRNFTPAFVVKTWGLMHGFSDTRHRFVDYRPVASSRYGEYFRQAGKEGTLQPIPGLDLTRRGKPARVNILSSARPLPPEVEYIIPTFNWIRSGEKDKQTHTRQGGGLRVYMKRPWFTSGEGELLAAVIHPGGTLLSVAGDDKVLYSQWGTDPIYPLPGDKSLFLTAGDFRWHSGQDKGLVYPGVESLRASTAAFPVKFDAERKLWYSDLMINPGNKYFPFVKLMLARYQQHSLRINQSDVCLSPVVETDFIQLLPERKVQLMVERRSGRAVRLLVQISGMRYQDFTNHFEVNIVSEDIPQPMSAIISHAVPARGARTQQAALPDIRFPDQYSFIAGGFFEITAQLRDLPFNVVVLEYEKPDMEGNRRLVFSDEFLCGK